MGEDNRNDPSSRFTPMFEQFRAALDEHHDRRERIIKASRDITAASKKIIFSLQRVRTVNEPLPPDVLKRNKHFYDAISVQFQAISKDLQHQNAHRYSRQISSGCQEYVEAAAFQHYLETATLLSLDDAKKKMRDLDPEGPGVELSHEDYILGIYDLTGELMRFAITAMALHGRAPTIYPKVTSGGERIEPITAIDQRSLLTDMRALRSALEGLDVGATGPFALDVAKKAEVMCESVEKVEKTAYALYVRGGEVHRGWMPNDSNGTGGKAVEVGS